MIQPPDLIVTDEVIRFLNRRRELLNGVAIIEAKLESIREAQISDSPDHPKFRHLKPLSEKDSGGKVFEAKGFDFRPIDSTFKREFPCFCARVFPSFLERESHISLGLDGCGRDGELQNRRKKQVYHDEMIKGNPVKSKKKPLGFIPADFNF